MYLAFEEAGLIRDTEEWEKRQMEKELQYQKGKTYETAKETNQRTEESHVRERTGLEEI